MLTNSPDIHWWSILCVPHQQLRRTVPPCCHVLCVLPSRPRWEERRGDKEDNEDSVVWGEGGGGGKDVLLHSV